MIPDGKTVRVEATSPQDQTATLVMADGRQYDYNLATLLDFRVDLSKALSEHAALQQFWESISTDLLFRAREFEETGYAQWWAHARRYSRWVLKGTGQKDTIEGLKDSVIWIFSSGLSELQQAEFAKLAYKGCGHEMFGGKKAPSGTELTDFNSFCEEMYVYYRQGWTYEHTTAAFRKLEESAKRAQSIAKTLSDRSFKMKEFSDLESAKYGNIGPLTIDELVERVARRVKGEHKEIIESVANYRKNREI